MPEARSYLVDPFDLSLSGSTALLEGLQMRFAQLLRALPGPARFVTWHRPADLSQLIEESLAEAARVNDAARRRALMAYRRWYEDLEKHGRFRSALCGLMLWPEHPAEGDALAGTLSAVTGSAISPAAWPPLSVGRYRLAESPCWHLEPVGRPAGRPYLAFLSAAKVKRAEWTFFHPLGALFATELPIAVSVDIARTWPHHEAVSRLEGVITALSTHLATANMVDSGTATQLADCQATLTDLHAGEALHEVAIQLAIGADSPGELCDAVDEMRKKLAGTIALRLEVGVGQLRAAGAFASARPETTGVRTWPMVSGTAALCLGFLGMRRMRSGVGVIRGVSPGGWPTIQADWEGQEKKALHECWVGSTGSGKTFALNCYLSRSYARTGVPFDLLEPMGHGHLLAEAFDLETFSLSSRETCLNPHDPVFPVMGEQVGHVISLYETFLGRSLSGTPEGNLQRALLAGALNRCYEGRDLLAMTPGEAPLVEDVCEVLSESGDTERMRTSARELAEEIAGLATGQGPFAHVLNGHTSVDFSLSGEGRPRVFCFDRMHDSPVITAIAYTQVLAAILRTATRDDVPRVIAVDEVYRMMRHPSLLDFLILATKTLRTHRKKVILIDQQLRTFLTDPKARLLFENCPIRVIFAQKGGEDILADDPAFAHYTDAHRAALRSLARYHFLLENEEGIFHLYNLPEPSELRRFSGS